MTDVMPFANLRIDDGLPRRRLLAVASCQRQTACPQRVDPAHKRNPFFCAAVRIRLAQASLRFPQNTSTAAGSTIMSPIQAVIMISALKPPKLTVGAKLLKSRTPKPMVRMTEVAVMALPFSMVTVYSASRTDSFRARAWLYSVR